jgi:hypothetical protein
VTDFIGHELSSSLVPSHVEITRLTRGENTLRIVIAGLAAFLDNSGVNDLLRQRLASNRDGGAGIGGGIILGLFGIFWCSLVGAFDYIAIHTLVLQAASAHYAATPAHIVKSEVTSHRGSKGGTTYGVGFEYTYAVNGTIYRGTRHTFNNSSSSDRDWAREAVAAFPAGSDRVCYYDPQNPERVVLAPGIHGGDLMILMFLTPFNIIATFLICVPIMILLDRRRPATVAPRISDHLHGREAYLMKSYNPIGTFLGTLLVTSFVGIFAVAIPSGFHPSIARVGSVWGMEVAIALGITIYMHLKMKSGRYDLVLDYNSRSITVPPLRQRKISEIVPMADVKQFDTAKVITGVGKNRRTTWQVKLVDRTDRELVVSESYLERNATLLAETLNEKVKS